MTRNQALIGIAIVALIGPVGPALPPARAADEPEPYPWSFAARWENDTFGGSDRFYTDGVSLSLSYTGRNWLDPVADWLPFGQGRRTVGYEIAQAMFTPSDTDLKNPDPKDRPYAGILAFGLSLHIEHDNVYHGLKVIGGVVGPASLAETTQDTVHDLIGSDKARGWDHQLGNEPIFNLVYEHRRKYRLLGEPHGPALEAIPVGNVMLGNMLTQAQLGGQFRFGYNIPDDFGASLLRGMSQLPPPRWSSDAPAWGVYFFAGGGANFVAHDITLDGNTGRDSRSVDKKWFVPAGEFGVAAAHRRFTVAFAYVFWGDEFDGQREHSEFGALTVAYRS
jgi:lipid A 3-O-deacylase